MKVWEELVEFFHCYNTVEGMEYFMSNVAVLGE